MGLVAVLILRYCTEGTSHDLVCCLEVDQLQNENHLISTNFSPDTSSVSAAWEAVWNVFKREFSAQQASEEFQGL
jgi:hypothetical protein